MNGDLLEDLILYKQYKERSVKMAAHSLIGTFRRIMPDLLRKKDRGRPTEASVAIEAPKYGKVQASEFVPGAEVLFGKDNKDTEEIDNSDSEVRKPSNHFSLMRAHKFIILLKSVYVSIRIG